MFVQNRIAEINKNNNVEFCYINTHENPGDMPSRGATSKELKDSTVWWNRPQWPQASFTEWPTWNTPTIVQSVLNDIRSQHKGQRALYETSVIVLSIK